MSVIRPTPQSQVHDGFATIRTRGLGRAKSFKTSAINTTEKNYELSVNKVPISRYRTFSLKSDLSYNGESDLKLIKNNNKSKSSLVKEEETIDTKDPFHLNMPSSLSSSYSTFRPASFNSSSSSNNNINNNNNNTSNNINNTTISSSSDYNNIKNRSQFSLESLPSSATPKTPEFSINEDNIFLFSDSESSQSYCPHNDMSCSSNYSPKKAFLNLHSVSSANDDVEPYVYKIASKNSMELQDCSVPSHHQKYSTMTSSRSPSSGKTSTHKKHPVRSATLKYTKRQFSNESECKRNWVADLEQTKLTSNTIIGNPLNDHPPKGKTHLDYYSPMTNYYQPQGLSNGNRSSSAEILDHHPNHFPSELFPSAGVQQYEVNGKERYYHTLGHPRVSGVSSRIKCTRSNTTSPTYGNLMPTSHSVSSNKSHPPYLLKSWNSSEFNIADYIDPLDCKIGCQTTLRCKPLIPWYELAIKRTNCNINRKSCPPLQAHVVAAFEQSLANMTQRLQQLTATAERKDSELTDMRQTIELLRKQSIQAGLTTAHMQSMGVQTNYPTDPSNTKLSARDQQIKQQQHHSQPPHKPQYAPKPQNQLQHPETLNGNVASGMQRHHSSDSMCSLNSISSGCSTQDKKKKKGWLRSSFTKAFSRNAKISKTNRHVQSNQNSNMEQQHQQLYQLPQHNVIAGQQQVNEVNSGTVTSGNLSASSPSKSPQKTVAIIENAKPVDAIELEGNPVVEDLKKQLREKDLVLTDIRLEALSSASQLESLKDTVMKMRAEMITLKQNNERLQKLVTSRSLAGSEASLGNAVSPNGSIGESRRFSLADAGNRPPMELPKSLEEEVEEENIPPAPAPEPPPTLGSPTTHIDLTPPPPPIEVPSPTRLAATAVEDVPDPTEGKKISISVYLGQPDSFQKYTEEILESDNYYSVKKCVDDESQEENGFENRSNTGYLNHALNEFVIAYIYISGKTSWQNLDYIVRKTFKDYVSRIDPGTNLGLNTDSITSYHVGEAKRGPEMGFPELLPCGYIVGNVKTLYICLQGVGSLAFDSLIPRSIVHRYITLLTEHRRLILCGPSGTGKSYLARKLAEFLVARAGKGNPSEAIATFNVDHKSSKELRQYLSHIAEQASIANGASELPSVIILDNLHHASALGDVFSCLLSAGSAAQLPCIIGTMSQATCNTTNLQLHHNFRWVLTANHMEPVKGFLGRFLRRRLFTLELSTQCSQSELSSVLAWLPSVWQHINRFLENHSSSDVTIGPRLFLSCPLDLKDSQVWFTDIWNYHLAPYLIEAVKEGVQLYGRRGGAWNDPSAFIRDTYPWPYGPDSVPPLRQISAEDVGLEADPPGNGDTQDPLLNMLIRLQEAANYSGNQEQESDCGSLDSNITPDSSAGAE